ncbi:hypothetical protein D3C71_1254480 [compost metagenome]
MFKKKEKSEGPINMPDFDFTIEAENIEISKKTSTKSLILWSLLGLVSVVVVFVFVDKVTDIKKDVIPTVIPVVETPLPVSSTVVTINSPSPTPQSNEDSKIAQYKSGLLNISLNYPKNFFLKEYTKEQLSLLKTLGVQADAFDIETIKIDSNTPIVDFYLKDKYNTYISVVLLKDKANDNKVEDWAMTGYTTVEKKEGVVVESTSFLPFEGDFLGAKTLGVQSSEQIGVNHIGFVYHSDVPLNDDNMKEAITTLQNVMSDVKTAHKSEVNKDTGTAN